MLGLSRQSQGAGLQALDSRLRGNDKGGFCSHRSQGQRCNGAASTVVLCLYKFHSHRSQGQRCNFAIHEWTEGAKYVSLPPEPGAALQLLLMLASASSIAVSLPPEPGAALQPYRAPLGLLGPYRFTPTGARGSVATATPPVPAVQLGGFTPTGARGSVATTTPPVPAVQLGGFTPTGARGSVAT